MSMKFGEWFRINYRNVIIGALVVVPLLVSLISTIHVVNFFMLSNYSWLAVTLAVAFEIGALSSLAALAVMDKISKYSLWLIFILITVMQMMGNTYYAFDFITFKMKTHPEWTQNWIDLFSINGSDLPATKRILAIVSGAILPIIYLTFLHILISYISGSKEQSEDEYEYVTVDENGNEIEQEVIEVNLPFVRLEEDIKPVETILKTNNESNVYVNVDTITNKKLSDSSNVEKLYNEDESPIEDKKKVEDKPLIPQPQGDLKYIDFKYKNPVEEVINSEDFEKDYQEYVKETKVLTDTINEKSDNIIVNTPDTLNNKLIKEDEEPESIEIIKPSIKIGSKKPIEIDNPDTNTFVNDVIKSLGLKDSKNTKDLNRIIKHLEQFAKPDENGELTVEISDLLVKDNQDTSIVENNTQKPEIRLSKQESPIIYPDNITTINNDPETKNIIPDHVLPISNHTPEGKEIVTVVPEVYKESIDNPLPNEEILITKDETFDSVMDFTGDENPIVSKKKILIYKEKQKRMYNGYE